MHKFIVFLIFVGLGYLGYVIWKDVEKKLADKTPAVTPSVTPPPIPAPAATPKTAAESRFAPEGVVFVVTRFSEPHEDGVRGFSPGMEVRLLREEGDHYVVTDGAVESKRPRGWFTREIALAKDLRAQKLLTDEQIARRQAEERAAYEAMLRERAIRWDSAIAAVDAARDAGRTAAPQSAVGSPGLRPLRLGAWNLEFFGSRNDPPRTDEDVQAIADFIRGLDVQILAVSEINGPKPLKDLVKRIGPSWKFVVGTSGHVGQEGQVAPGLLWDDSRVDLIGAGELSELAGRLPSGLVFHREPVVGAFRDRAGGPDFRIVSVHLKAGRTPEDFERREAEAKALRGHLEKLLADGKEDNDIIIMGDFNHDASAKEADIFRDGNFARFLVGRGRSVVHFNRQIDHAVPLRSFEEVKESTFSVHNREGLRDPKSWRDTYSDHFPVTVDLAVGPDDDPSAKLGTLGRRIR